MTDDHGDDTIKIPLRGGKQGADGNVNDTLRMDPEVADTLRIDPKVRKKLQSNREAAEKAAARMLHGRPEARVTDTLRSGGGSAPEQHPRVQRRKVVRSLALAIIVVLALGGVVLGLVQRSRQQYARSTTAYNAAETQEAAPAEGEELRAEDAEAPGDGQEVAGRQTESGKEPEDRVEEQQLPEMEAFAVPADEAAVEPGAGQAAAGETIDEAAPATEGSATGSQIGDLEELEQQLANLEEQLVKEEQATAGGEPAPHIESPATGVVEAAEVDSIKISAFVRKAQQDEKKAADLAEIAVAQSKQADFDPYLAAALIMAESSWDTNAASSKGKTGLLQISADTEKRILRLGRLRPPAGATLRDPAYNLQLGLWYLKFLRFHYKGNLEEALMAYNIGFENFEKLRDKGGALPPLTLRYLQNVETFYRELVEGPPLNFTFKIPPKQEAAQAAAVVAAPAEDLLEQADAAAQTAGAERDAKALLTEILAATVVPAAEKEQTAELVLGEAARAGVDPLLAAAVIMAESSFNSGAVSEDGKIGLMQIHPARAPEIAKAAGIEWRGAEELKNAAYNLQLGLGYLAYCLNAHPGDRSAALLEYNLGPEAAAAIAKGTHPLSPLTSRYLKNVKDYSVLWSGERS